MAPNKGLSYRDAGVNIDAGDALVEGLKPLARSTGRPGVMSGLGGFGACFDLKAAGYKDPILVSGTDGVGTKLKIAISAARHKTVGIDLVAMCVNDLVVQGAEPLFFLDYFATGALKPDTANDVLTGIAEGCREAGAALIGGETAEMPGMYAESDYDLAGFCVGAVERDQVLTGENITSGDIVLGLASSGVHSNGFSLVRKVVEHAGLDFEGAAPFATSLSLGEALLTPTKIYVKSCLSAIRAGGVKGLAHITGGGLIENIPRILPSGLGVELDGLTWSCPPVFRWLASEGNITEREMTRTFNCGIGMAVIVDPDRADNLMTAMEAADEIVSKIGTVIPQDASDSDRVQVLNLGF